jgi:hypothetical protein
LKCDPLDFRITGMNHCRRLKISFKHMSFAKDKGNKIKHIHHLS